MTNPYTGVEVCSEDEEELKALEDIFDVPDMIDICSTWSKSIIELTYNVDDELEGMVGDALVKLGLEYNNKTEDADIIIKVGEYSSEPGHTDYTYNNIGQIMHSDIVIAEKTEERVIHELMHGLGIGHANYPTSIMSEVIVPGAKLSACEFDAIAAVVDVAGTSDSVSAVVCPD